MKEVKTTYNLEGRQTHYPVLNPVGDYEYWSFSIKTNTGEFIKAYFSLNELFTVPVKSSVNFIHIDKVGRETKESIIITSDQCSFNQEKLNVSIGENYCIKRDDYYELNVLINGAGCNLKLYPKFPSWQKGKSGIVSKNLTGSIYLGWSMPIPYAKVEGKVLINNEENKIIGFGSLDHVWGNQNVGEEAKYMLTGSCFLENSIWSYHVGLMSDNVIGAKLICINENGESFSYMKDFDQKDINVEILEYLEYPNNTIPKLVEIKNKKAEIDLLIEIKEKVTKGNQFSTKLKATECIDFLSEVSLQKKKSKLKKTINTRTVTELYIFE
jgi:hypothetical protein